ncbi:hypothetical protein [Saccharothrix texasensis]|uniref:hypothetical protein n=1 Tax=Saccharothrix texasensis TaxID=103734 RepID=UPI001477063D|nr:hypothetical protein [Saccharothrix texasensis]
MRMILPSATQPVRSGGGVDAVDGTPFEQPHEEQEQQGVAGHRQRDTDQTEVP